MEFSEDIGVRRRKDLAHVARLVEGRLTGRPLELLLRFGQNLFALGGIDMYGGVAIHGQEAFRVSVSRGVRCRWVFFSRDDWSDAEMVPMEMAEARRLIEEARAMKRGPELDALQEQGLVDAGRSGLFLLSEGEWVSLDVRGERIGGGDEGLVHAIR